MKTIKAARGTHCLTRFCLFLTTVASVVGMVGCIYTPPSQDLEIRTWYDLDAVRDNLSGHHILMNDLDSTTAGYTELASSAANAGKGWEPIGAWPQVFTGSFNGQGYEIRDLFVSRSKESFIGLFSYVSVGGVVKNLGVMNVDVTGHEGVGGLVGVNWQGAVSKCCSSGNVIGYYRVGGLAGSSAGTVSNSFSSANVDGVVFVGGLVGYNSDTLTNSYSTGSVTGNGNVGGLVGENDGTVSDSYCTGSVSGYGGAGGLAGFHLSLLGQGTVNASFWDIETSGQSNSAGGTGKATDEMQDMTTFSGAGWDINGVDQPNDRNTGYVWNMVDGATYPFLSWQLV
jgi:hypothetical protein